MEVGKSFKTVSLCNVISQKIKIKKISKQTSAFFLLQLNI